MSTETLTTCTGTIQSNGYCDKCYQPAQTTSNQCGRLIPMTNQPKQKTPLQEFIDDLLSGKITEVLSNKR